MDDWRLTDQEQYLMNRTLIRKEYTIPLPAHEHCDFCWKTFSLAPGDLSWGYTTLEEDVWICDQCFEDFREQFEWKVIHD